MHHDGTPTANERETARDASEAASERLARRRSIWARLADDLMSLPAAATIRLGG